MLTPLELDIMKAVWRNSPITVRDVQDSIRPDRNLAYTTVMTIMDRLHHKGFLSRTLRARTHYYQSAIDYTDVRDEAVDLLIRNFFGSKENLQEFLQGESAAAMPAKIVSEPAAAMPAKIVSEPAPVSRLDETLL